MLNSASVDMISKLIGFDTTSRNSNVDLIQFTKSFLEEHGAQCEVVAGDTPGKVNLFATIGKGSKPGVILSGHCDTVPVEGQAWSTDPFNAVVRDNRIFGRGACDMKGFLGCALAYAPKFASASLNAPIHYAISYDEEIGCVGVRHLLAKLTERDTKPALCVVGEPTEMNVFIGHKGKVAYRVTVEGRAAHSSLAPYGVNAVEYAARLVTFISDQAEKQAIDGPFDDAFTVPFSTIHTGLIHGGTQLNIVSHECHFDWEMRHLPSDLPGLVVSRIQEFAERELLSKMHEVDPDLQIKWEKIVEVPGLDIAPEDDAVKLAHTLTESAGTNKVAFGTEAGLFQKMAGIPTVVCGPGDIGQAHQPDEYISIPEIEKCERFLNNLLSWAQT